MSRFRKPHFSLPFRPSVRRPDVCWQAAAIIWRQAFAISLLLASTAVADDSLPTFKLYIEAPGPYRVSYEDLVTAGLQKDALPSAGLGVTNEERPIPVWVEDGGDGTFGPGDWLEMIGQQAPGWVSHLNENTRYNVYFLRFDMVEPLRMTAHRPRPKPPSEDGIHHAFNRRRHHERDFMIHRTLTSHDNRPSELWYWAKLSQIDAEPLTHPIFLDDLDWSSSSATVDLEIELRGWSRPGRKDDPEMADHRVEALLNGKELAATEWNGTESHRWKISEVPVKTFIQGKNDLAFRVPKRAAGPDGDWLVDVILLNWIEVVYPRISEVGGGWADVELRNPRANRLMLVRTRPGVDFVLYGMKGSRMISDALPRWPERGDFFIRVFDPPPGESSFIAVGPDRLVTPKAIILDRPSKLRSADSQADYIMIVHRRLLEAIQPLAEFHRSRGLKVEVVDLQDVYDEFSGGMIRPQALRAFLEHAYHNWQSPAPRFVLLAGDASWTGKDVLIGDGSFTDYVEAPKPEVPGVDLDEDEMKFTVYEQQPDLANRQLIPTWNQTTIFGHAANDNYFVAVAGDDDLPDMALGRLTVVNPEELTAVVEKTIRYASTPEVGPWRRNIVFLTNTLKRFHKQSKRVARKFNAEGFSTEEIYPRIEEEDNAQYTRRLLELLNEGQLAIHYLGHGGRYIWETGRRDLKENRDLFTFEDLETLNPTQRLPVVLSLTCYSAPFDHPDADSLGEKLLRISDRGAIAVIAASWTNGPSGTWGQIILEEMTEPGATIGEAFMRAKHRNPSSMFVNVYNLLGDPAVPVALPTAEIEVLAEGGEEGPLKVSGTLNGGPTSGEVLVEVLGQEGEILSSKTSRLRGSQFSTRLPAESFASARVVRAYAWDASSGTDAAGVFDLAPQTESDRPQRQGSTRAERRKAAREAAKAAAAPVATPIDAIRADTAAWWSFDEADGTEVRNRLGDGHGTLMGRANRAAGPRGNALSFFEQGYVDFGNQQLDVGTGDFTIQAWVSTRQAREQVWVILDKRAPSGYHLFNYLGRLGLQIAADGEFTNYTGPFIADGEWHHIVVTVDRDAADGVRWFVDGAEAGSRQDPTAHQGSLDNPSHLYFGGRQSGGGNFLGDLDELAIFRRALSALDVEKLYRSGWELLAGEASAAATSAAASSTASAAPAESANE